MNHPYKKLILKKLGLKNIDDNISYDHQIKEFFESSLENNPMYLLEVFIEETSVNEYQKIKKSLE